MINNTEPKVINTIDRGIKKAISPSSNSISVPATKKLTKPLRKNNANDQVLQRITSSLYKLVYICIIYVNK